MNERPIADYGLIGDTRTAALCSSEGSIDWMCLPRFDSEPVFSRLIAGARGGSFSIAPVGLRAGERRYRPGSAVLESAWETATGRARLSDAMVAELKGSLLPEALLVRRIRCEEGKITLRLCFDPRLGLGRNSPRVRQEGGRLVCSWGALAIALLTSPPMEIELGVEKEVRISKGETLIAAMSVADRSPLAFERPGYAAELLEATDTWWRSWSGGFTYTGPFRDAVVRSLITLRLLTYSPSGAPVAAPTTSLPESIGGVRNWDYRFSWPRDASIGLAAFLAAGKVEEARSFMHWLLHASRLTRPRLEVLYTIFGKPGPHEREYWDVLGYRNSLPVRVGNAASTQHQLDVYGWVVDAAWLLVSSGHPLPGETWRAVSGFADHVASCWREPDAGIWEVRDRPAHHVHSKLMAWVALDRALRIADTHRIGRSRRQMWADARTALAADVRKRGFDPELGTYVRAYGSREVDAAALILPVLEFETDASRTRGTIDAIRASLGAGGPLLYRYPPGHDGLTGDEGAFLPCSFWLVQALARLGEIDVATDMFGELLSLGNDLGLFSEECDPETGELLGNFPQAFTHATLIQAARALERAYEGPRKEPSRIP
jgi:GH15 family glucan-1,4-alpha-glucosidase